MFSTSTKPAPAPLPTDEALATLAHELRDPLATILLALDLHSGDGDSAARRALATAAHQARRAVRIVDDLFDLCAGSRGRLTLRKEVVELAEVVASAAGATAHLLANAAKLTDPGGDVRLTAGAEAGQAVLRVRDNGRGIALELLPRVFDRFWQGPGRGDKGALGL